MGGGKGKLCTHNSLHSHLASCAWGRHQDARLRRLKDREGAPSSREPHLTHVAMQALEGVKTKLAETVTPAESLKGVLQARDKKAALLELAGKNGINAAFIQLLDENIATAGAAQQQKAVEVMTKLRAEASRYLTA